MAENIALVAESLQDYKITGEVKQLNEGGKNSLVKFIKDPSRKKSLVSAYARQLGRTKGLKELLLKLSDEDQLKIAKRSYEIMQKNPKLGFPWMKIEGRKITDAGALPVKKSSLGAELGQ